MIGRRIGRYEIDRLLGEGGVGRVYAARDSLLGRQVAIKTLRPEASRNQDFIERFYNEAKSFGDLRHPNITTLYDLDLSGQPPYMVMELVEGHTLEELLEFGPLPARECLAVAAQAAAGLTAAHRKGVIHRDIKPSNLMVTESGLLKIMDFGIARVRGSQRLTRADQVFATLLYASPEQLRGGEVDERSDVYSLGAVLYEMLAGAPPFTADSDGALRTAHLEVPPPPLAPLVPGLDPRLAAGVMRALAKRPGERFATADAFAQAIGAAAIARDAAEILQDHLAPILRRAAGTPETRLLNLAQESGRTILVGPTAGAHAAASGRPRAAALRRPIAAAAAAMLAVLLGVGYLLWAPGKPAVAPAQATAEAPPPAQAQPPGPAGAPPSPAGPEPRQAALTPPAPTPPDSGLPAPRRPAEAPDNPQPQERGADTPPALPNPSPLPAETPSPNTAGPSLANPNPPNPGPINPAAVTPSPAPERHAAERADLEGVVTAVKSAALIRIGDRWIELYGITDPTSNKASHVRAMANLLGASRGAVKCYERPGSKYRCLVNGNDLALMALYDKIARPALDAPADYAAAMAGR